MVRLNWSKLNDNSFYFVIDDADDVNNKSAGSSSSMSAAAKRKGSFKKWLRSSHRKLTSNSANSRPIRDTNGAQKLNNSDLDSLKIKVILRLTFSLQNCTQFS